jgi:hypothetical protein
VGIVVPPQESFLRRSTLWALFALAAAVLTLTGRKDGTNNWTTAAALMIHPSRRW